MKHESTTDTTAKSRWIAICALSIVLTASWVRADERPNIVLIIARGHAAALQRFGADVLPASTEHVRMDNRDSPGTCEILSSPQQNPRLETPGYQLRALAGHSSAKERRKRVQAEVPPSEGNEARRDGRQEVIAPW